MATIRLYRRDGKMIGTIDSEKREFYKQVVGSKHIMHTPPAIAIDAELYDLYRDQFEVIRVKDTETGRVYQIGAWVFDTYRVVIDRGFGKQYACPLQYWQVHDPAAVQLGLFE